MPVLLIDDDPRILEHPRVASLEPVVEPSHRLIAPFIHRAVVAAVREAMVPWTDPGLQRRFHFLQHAWNAVTVSVLQAADQEGGYLQGFDRPQRRAPERAVALMLHVVERPGWGVHAWADHRLVQAEVRRSGTPLIQIHREFEFIDVKYAVDVVHVFLEQLLGGGNGENGLERGGLPQRHLDRIETSPGYAQHSDLAVRPGLTGEPGNDFLRILLLLCRVFSIGRRSLALAESPYIDACADIAAPCEISVGPIVACGLIVVLSIREVFEQRRKA